MPGYSHLLDDERNQIAGMRAAGHSVSAIARALRCAKSTVSRELRRNALPSGLYSPLHAAGDYVQCRRCEAVLEKDHRLRAFVCDRLAEGWTPEQIAGWLKVGNERRLLTIDNWAQERPEFLEVRQRRIDHSLTQILALGPPHASPPSLWQLRNQTSTDSGMPRRIGKRQPRPNTVEPGTAIDKHQLWCSVQKIFAKYLKAGAQAAWRGPGDI